MNLDKLYKLSVKYTSPILFIGGVMTVSCLLFQSVLLCRITAFILPLICVILGCQEKKIINPYFLFALTPFSLFMYVNLGGFYMVELTPRTWNIALMNIMAFILALRFTPNVKHRAYSGMNISNGFYKHMFFLYLLTLIAPFSGPFSSVLYLLSAVIIVLAFSTRNKYLIIAYTVLILFNIITGSSSKMGILTLLLAYIISYEHYYVKSLRERKRIIYAALLAVPLMVFSFSFANKERGHYNAEDGLAYYSRGGNLEWNLAPSLFLPYMYLETPWVNLQYVTETQDNRTYGMWALKPLLGYLGLRDDEDYKLEPYSSFNTFTFISCQFKDFGYYGSVLLSLFLGFFVKKTYSLSIRSNSPFYLGGFVLVALATLEMFFSNHFFMQSYPFTIFIMMWLYQKVFFELLKK